jgi:hypothetical protein
MTNVHHEKQRERSYSPLGETCEVVLAPFDSSLPRAALLHDQSDHGCSILCVMPDAPKVGDTLLLKTGRPEPLRVRVAFALEPSGDVRHIGCEFLRSETE